MKRRAGVSRLGRRVLEHSLFGLVWLWAVGACTPETGGRDIPVALGGIANPHDPEMPSFADVNPEPDESMSVNVGVVAGEQSAAVEPPPAEEMSPDEPTMAESGGQSGDDTLAFFDTGNQSRNQVEAGRICARLSTLQCAGQAHCCNEAQQDFATCQRSVRADCEAEGLIDQIAADPRSGFNPQQAERTLSELERLAMACDPAVSAWIVSPEGLLSMFRGTLPLGESCRPPVVTSRVRAAPYLAACTDPEKNACLPSSLLTWRCSGRGSAGSECFTDLNCQEGLYCPQNNYLNPEIGRSACARRLEDGSPCRAANECASLVCYRQRCAPADSNTAYCIQ